MTWLIWMIVFLVFLGIEIVTPGIFFFLCFSIGALFSMFAALFEFGGKVEMIVFYTVSLACLVIIRPLFKMYIAKKKVATNVDSLIGAPALVMEQIYSNSTGKVKVANEIWLAVSKQDIQAGETVIIENIDGTKLVVKKVEEIEVETEK